MRPCTFCPEKATTREHALPEWIAKRFGLSGKFLRPYATGGNVAPRKQDVSVQSMRRKIFCQECQEHFKHVEDAVIPLLEPMSRGERVILGSRRQELLARWGAKTAYAMFGFADRDHLIPQEHRRIVRQTKSPPLSVFVGYGHYTGPTDVFISFIPFPASDTRTPRMAYHAIAAFGQVFLKVFGVIEPAADDTFRIPKGRVIQVWPPGCERITWPPPIPLGAGDIDDLIGWLPVAPHPIAPTTIVEYPRLPDSE